MHFFVKNHFSLFITEYFKKLLRNRKKKTVFFKDNVYLSSLKSVSYYYFKIL